MTVLGCSRFAPSATGPAHPGTLLAGLLCWLDARHRGHRVILRIEDLDPQRCNPRKVQDLIDQLQWFGLDDWDTVEIQSQHNQRHQHGLQQLVDSGLVYSCICSRSIIRAHNLPAADGGWVYPGTCRGRVLSQRAPDQSSDQVLRIQIDGRESLCDESGADLSQDIAQAMGDPVLVRRDGAISYHLASVIDDSAMGVTRVVRGQDLAASSALQARLRRLLGDPIPQYRHHFLLLQPHGAKLAKFHQAVGVPELAQKYTGPQLCGFLAWISGLKPDATPCLPQDLLPHFTWQRVSLEDRVLHWDGSQLHGETSI
ncbi:MAG: hypothetical protein EA401_08625 [Planctomycetota bacterium]|nr:MAG: hypothetical protein EA401_08625 [Planctomycetota bacterium]